jgi:hypothetical protein
VVTRWSIKQSKGNLEFSKEELKLEATGSNPGLRMLSSAIQYLITDDDFKEFVGFKTMLVTTYGFPHNGWR